MDTSLAELIKRTVAYRSRKCFVGDSPCDIYQHIFDEGVTLRFTATSTLAGLYLAENGVAEIDVSALRPAGLRRFTAAHELGHHIFGHGARIDRDLEYKQRFSSFTPDERAADIFASFLLMPRAAVRRGLALFTEPQGLTPAAVYRTASWLGVGYSTLLNQMRFSLGMLNDRTFHRLQVVRPQEVKRGLVPIVRWAGRKELWPLSPPWSGQRIHVQIGDVLTGLNGTGPHLQEIAKETFVAVGVGELACPIHRGAEVQISVSKGDYVGLYDYMYLPEPDDA